MKTLKIFSCVAAAVFFAACNGVSNVGNGLDDENGANGDGAGDDTNQPPAALCTGGAVYSSFTGADLKADRQDELSTKNLGRVKPGSAIQTELQRVGVTVSTPATLTALATSLGTAPARWYQDPVMSGVTVFTAFRAAFDGCVGLTATAPEFGSSPAGAAAEAQCKAMARKFWSRDPSADEVAACTKLGTDIVGKEADPRLQWSYVCASLLTSAGFLSY